MSSTSNVASLTARRSRRRVPGESATDAAEERFNLAGAALAVAGDEYPRLDAASYLRHLDVAADTIRARLRGSTTLLDTLRELSRYLYEDAGYTGNLRDYNDPRNSYLNQVIERRTGTPLTLSIIFLEVGWRLGLPLEGVAFPGHFLVKCSHDDTLLVLDPFFRGTVVGEGDLLNRVARVTAADDPAAVLPLLLAGAKRREIIVRLLRNLKGIFQEFSDYPRLVRVADQLVHYAPGAAEERRDRGFAYLALDADAAALRDFRRYLELRPGADDVERIRDMVEDLELRVPPSH